MTSATTVRPASARQVEYICALAAKRTTWINVLPSGERETVIRVLENERDPRPKFISFAAADAAIKAMLSVRPDPTIIEKPFSSLQRTLTTVHAGFYALYRKESGTVDFFEVVEHHEKGKKTSTKWVNRLFGSTGSWRRERMFLHTQVSVARVIASNPTEAALNYATHFTSCPRCDAPLSTKRSRTAKIGPRCAKMWGWVY